MGYVTVTTPIRLGGSLSSQS